MRIGLIDVDGTNFPNLPLMKISAWHKQQGDTVEWYDHEKGEYMDIVYKSKVFSSTPDYPYMVNAGKILGGVLDIVYMLKMVKRFLTKRSILSYRLR